MALTGQQYLDLLGDRIRSLRARYMELDRVWSAFIVVENNFRREHNIPPPSSDVFAQFTQWYTRPFVSQYEHALLFRFARDSGEYLHPYFARLQAAANEARAGRNRIEDVTVATEAQINSANEMIQQANVWINRADLWWRTWSESTAGLLMQGNYVELAFNEILGVGYGQVYYHLAQDTSETAAAAAAAMARALQSAAGAAAGIPAWLQYSFALAAFTGAGYLWFKYLR